MFETRYHANDNVLIALEGKHRMSKVSLNSVVSTLDIFIQQHVDSFKAKVKDSLRIQGIDETFFDRIEQNNMLHKFTSDYQQKKCYTRHCHLVNPIDIVLGSIPQLRQGSK